MKSPLLSSIHRALLLLAALAFSLTARAGTWSTTPWTGDSTTYLSSPRTLWAYHFGSVTPATVNGVSVSGIVGPTHTSAQFDLAGTSGVFNGFTNNLTALGGTGSAVMAADFVYSGNPASITVKGLVAGNTYTVSFYGVDFNNDTRLNRFTDVSSAEFRDVDEHVYGNANGIRVDYTFTAAATTRAFTIAIQNPNFASWHLFGLSLRQETAPTTVTNAQDSGTGSLRWALVNAAAIAGANTVTFDPTLSGANIATLSELTVADAGGVTIDASALAVPVTISPGAVCRHFTHTAGSLALRWLHLVNGQATAAASVGPNLGGSVYSIGSAFAAFDCTFQSNTSGSSAGALHLATSAPSTVEGCTFRANTAIGPQPPAGAGGAIAALGTLTVRKSTFFQNGVGNPVSGQAGGAILVLGALTAEHCTFAGNFSGFGPNAGALNVAAPSATATLVNCIIAQSLEGTDVANNSGSAINLTYVGANIVRTQTNALFTGPAPLTTDPLLDAYGENGGPTETFALQFGSPAIDAATTIAGHGTDQRGVARPFDGDGNGTATPDLGAVEARFPIVSNGNDSGVGSLRQAVADAATFAGPDTIVFRSASFPSGGTVNLTTSLTIPASGDTAGVTLLTTVAGGNVDVAVNAGTFSWGEGSVWTGGGRILLGATNGSAAATIELPVTGAGATLAASIAVRAGSSGVKKLRSSIITGVNGYTGDITLAAPLTIEAVGDTIFEGGVDLGPQVLAVDVASGSQVSFFGRLARTDGVGIASLVKNGAGTLLIATDEDNDPNTRLAATVNAGTLLLQGDLNALGYEVSEGTNALTIAPGATAIIASDDQIASPGSVTVDGTLRLEADEGIGFLNGSGTVEPALSDRTLELGGGNFAGTLRNSGGSVLSLSIGGLTTLSGNSGATGGMTGLISVAGTLNVTGNVALSSEVRVLRGGALAGTGTVPYVNLIGLLNPSSFAPGDATVPGSIGTLNVAGDLRSELLVAWRYHLSATDNSSDRVAIAGVLGGVNGLRFDFQGTGAAGQTYTLANFASCLFTADQMSYTGLAPGLVGYFTKNATSLTFTVSSFNPVITSTADSGPGSLRQVIEDAAHIPGVDTIVVPSSLDGATITLSSEIAISDATGGVQLDARGLARGLTLSGGGTTRIFKVNAGNNLTLAGLTLTGGNAGGGSGGAVLNAGTLTAIRCTLSGNSAASGGAISNGGSVTLSLSTLAENSAATGGAIASQGSGAAVTVKQSTLSRNSATTSGGAIFIASGDLGLAGDLIAGNTAPSGPDIANSGNAIIAGNKNLLGNSTGSGLVAGPTLLTGDPRLGSLADHGGPTRTMALLAGSPAIDANSGVIEVFPTDQRGFVFSRDGDAIPGAIRDLGAYEAQAAPVGSAGFNFVGGGAGGPGGTLAAADVAGVPEFAQANWNNLSTIIDGAAHDGTYPGSGPVPIVAANGASFSPNLRLWWAAHHLWNISNAVQSTPDRRLMNGYLDSNVGGDGRTTTNLYASTASQPFFAVAGLPAMPGGYKLILYVDGDATDRVGEYWLTTNRAANPASVAGETDLTPHVFVGDTANFSGTYTRVPVSSTANQGASTPGGNYVAFEGLTEPGFIVRAEEGPISAPINAVQVVPNEIIVVTTTADELDANGTLGAGLSLREALRDAPEGAGIVFDSTLNGATLTLDPAKGEIVLTKDVTIDASNLSGGVTIDGGPGTNRIFAVSSGTTATLIGLTLTGGNGTGTLANNSGGAVLNQGWITLTDCIVSGNAAASSGGAIRNDGGTMALTRCTLSGNSASFGGALHSTGGSSLSVTLAHCTLSGNSAVSSDGGAIHNLGRMSLSHCTLFGNSAALNSGAISLFLPPTIDHCTIVGNSAGNQGGAMRISFGGVTLANSIVAGNIALDGADIYNNNGVVTRVGASLVESLVNSGGLAMVNGAGTISTAAPLLAPLGNYGGPTQTMALLPGSPARNAAPGSTATSDQRGFPIVGVPDIGAYEAGTFTNFNAFIWESLPATATLAQHAATFDFDTDGVTNLNEWLALTDPGDNASYLRVTQFTAASPNVTVTFPSVVGRSYTFESSSDLVAWTPIAGAPVAGTGGPLVIPLGPFPGATKLFVRVRTGP